ncbi:MAG: NAD(+)/NADH kinase [Bacteroidetes bacterium]|nr:NAD(+)/NADH kinase [Bacteroidota bacterium]
MKKKFTPPKNFSIGILGNVDKTSACETAFELIKILQERGINFAIQREISEQMRTRCGFDAGEASVSSSEVPRISDVIVSLGGDGTILRTAKIVGDLGKPILGVNLGKLGFLAELNFDELRNSIDGLLKGEFSLEHRTVLRASFGQGKEASSVFALNDVVIDKAGSPRMIDLETYVDSEYLITYRADGIVISTPTGSTGYCLSTGGPIISTESRVIAISPISPHTLSARPVIVPDSSEIRIVVRSAYKHVMLAADGQVSKVQAPPAEFGVSLAPHRITLLRKNTNGFFSLLRSKLMWGVDIRSSEESITGREKE